MDKFKNDQSEKVAKIIKKFSPFLKDFSYTEFSEKNGMNKWGFSHKFPDYIFRIIIAEKNDKWYIKIFVYWKNQSKEITMGAGKDFDYQLGPFNNFSDLVIDVERKIQNNPIMGHKLYDDDFELNMDKEAIPLLIKLKKSEDKLFSIDNSFFDDLKKTFKEIKNIPDDKLLNYCKIHKEAEADKQDFLLDLQKLHKLDYYIEMKKLGHTQ